MSQKNGSSNNFLTALLLALLLLTNLTHSAGAREDTIEAQNPSGPATQPQPPTNDMDGDGEPENPQIPVNLDVQEIELLEDPTDRDTTITWYQFFAANTFTPNDSALEYYYFGGGCIYRVSGSLDMNHSLLLPEGAEIDFMRVFYYDNDYDHDLRAHLYSYDGRGNKTKIASAESSGSFDGYSNAGSGFFSYIVHPQDEALILRLDFGNATTTDLQICGVRIRYQYASFGGFLPMITN